MKQIITIYAVGKNIDTKNYGGWFNRTFLKETMIAPQKTPLEFNSTQILKSFTGCEKLQYFPTIEAANDYAKKSAEVHPADNKFISCPVVFEVNFDLKKEKLPEGFSINNINSILIWLDGSNKIEKPFHLKLDNFIDNSFFSSSKPKIFKVNKNNFNGEINSLITPLSIFSFLCANKRGVQPKNQEQTYSLPKEIAKVICEFAMGHELKGAQKQLPEPPDDIYDPTIG